MFAKKVVINYFFATNGPSLKKKMEPKKGISKQILRKKKKENNSIKDWILFPKKRNTMS